MLWFLSSGRKKAIHTVDHDILLSKMNLYRIQGMALDLFKSYSTNHTQQCPVSGSFLESVHLNAGYCREQCRSPFFSYLLKRLSKLLNIVLA